MNTMEKMLLITLFEAVREWKKVKAIETNPFWRQPSEEVVATLLSALHWFEDSEIVSLEMNMFIEAGVTISPKEESWFDAEGELDIGWEHSWITKSHLIPNQEV